MIYKTPEDFNAVVRSKKDLEWIQSELNPCKMLWQSPVHPCDPQS